MAPLCQRHECGQRVQGNGCFEDIVGCHGESESCAFLHCHGAGAAHPHLSLLWVFPQFGALGSDVQLGTFGCCGSGDICVSRGAGNPSPGSGGSTAFGWALMEDFLRVRHGAALPLHCMGNVCSWGEPSRAAPVRALQLVGQSPRHSRELFLPNLAF